MSKFVAVAAIAAVAAAANLEGPTPVYKVSKATRIEVPPVPVCDDKTPYDPELGCASVKTVHPTTRCPSGYKSTKSGCQATQYGKSTVTCQKGSYLDGHKCVTDIIADPEITCHKGDLIDDETCMEIAVPTVVPAKTSPFLLSCDKGYRLEKDVCVKELASSATMICDDPNAKLVGSSCILYEYTDMECPKGYSRGGKGSCVATSSVPVSMVCPKGTMENKDGECVVKVTSAPHQICEKGYELNKSGMCEAKILITGTLLSANKPSTVDIDCKMGQMDKDGNCYQTITTAAATVCEGGFDFDGKTCVSFVPSERDVQCQAGWAMEGHHCVKVDHRSPSCPAGYIVSTSTTDKGYETGECVRASASTYSYVCPTGFNLAGSKTKKVTSSCTAVETLPATATCPKGYNTEYDMCVIPEYVVAGKDNVYPASVSCPKGYKLRDGMCVDTMTTEAIVFCDKGYELIGHRCEATFTADAQIVCPKNYIASEDGQSCTRVVYKRPTFVCPKGTDSVGKNCYTYVDSEVVTIPSTEGMKKGK